MSTKAEKEAAKRRARLQQQSAAAASEVESTVTKALATDSGTSAKPEKPPAPKKVRTTLYLRAELYARATNCAHYFKQKKQQPKSISQLLDDALERELERLSKQAGKDWSAQ